MTLVTWWYFIIIQNLHQTHDTHYYASLKNANQTPKKLHGYEHIQSTGFFIKKIGNFLKIRYKGNRKTNFIFQNFKDQKNGKIGGKTKFGTNIIKETKKKNLLAFKKPKNENIGKKHPKNILFIKETKQNKTMKRKQENKIFQKIKNKGKESKLLLNFKKQKNK